MSPFDITCPVCNAPELERCTAVTPGEFDGWVTAQHCHLPRVKVAGAINWRDAVKDLKAQLAYWPDVLAANLAMGGFGCEAFELGCFFGFETSQLLNGKPNGVRAWHPGCGRPAKKGG